MIQYYGVMCISSALLEDLWSLPLGARCYLIMVPHQRLLHQCLPGRYATFTFGVASPPPLLFLERKKLTTTVYTDTQIFPEDAISSTDAKYNTATSVAGAAVVVSQPVSRSPLGSPGCRPPSSRTPGWPRCSPDQSSLPPGGECCRSLGRVG